MNLSMADMSREGTRRVCQVGSAEVTMEGHYCVTAQLFRSKVGQKKLGRTQKLGRSLKKLGNFIRVVAGTLWL